MTPFTSDPTKFIIHISASLWGTERIIKNWHTDPDKQGGPYDDIGYHWVILNGQITPAAVVPSLDGMICPGRSLKFMGAHCRGQNQVSIGVCLVGMGQPTDKQLQSLISLHDDMCVHFSNPMSIHPHNEFNKYKTCPNYDVEGEWKRITKLQEEEKNIIVMNRPKVRDMSVGDLLTELGLITPPIE